MRPGSRRWIDLLAGSKGSDGGHPAGAGASATPPSAFFKVESAVPAEPVFLPLPSTSQTGTQLAATELCRQIYHRSALSPRCAVWRKNKIKETSPIENHWTE